MTQKQMTLLALEQIGFKMDDSVQILTSTQGGRAIPNGLQLAALIHAVTNLAAALAKQVEAQPDV